MAFSASLIGTLLLEKKESLIAEALSHASYPGILCAVLFMGVFGESLSWSLFIGAALSSLLALLLLRLLQRLSFSQDVTLCLVLSLFFGLGVLIASQIQFLYPSLYVAVPIYLFGQASTLTESHLFFIIPLSCIIAIALYLFYKEWQTIVLDPSYAEVLAIPRKKLSILFYGLLILSIIIGMRSCGVLLLSSLYIMPPIAARYLSNHFGKVLLLSALISMASAFLGLFLSVSFSTKGFPIPSGPAIVLVLALFCLAVLLVAPEKGLLFKVISHLRFKRACAKENFLKHLWKRGNIPAKNVSYLLRGPLLKQDLIWQKNNHLLLTEKGKVKAERIIRLHRLWELYLVDWVGINKERVHKSAEEIEHLLTPELEAELTTLLNDPKYDPHHQIIPAP